MLQTIQDAIASLAESLPDASHMMRHGDESGMVLSSSSRELSPDTVTADAPQEMARYVGRKCDFPTLETGSTVDIGGAWHIVTSARTDPISASLSFGASAPLDNVLAVYRRPGTQIRQPIRVLAVESAVLDEWADNLAPTSCRAWFIALSAEHWLENEDPKIGDEIAIGENTLRASAVAKHDGYWLITCRARR